MTPADQETELGVQAILSSRRRNNASGQGGEDIDNIRAALKGVLPTRIAIIHCVSLSTGKDSSATACLALETQPREALRFAACDTGNEHEEFPRYLSYMERHLGKSQTGEAQ